MVVYGKSVTYSDMMTSVGVGMINWKIQKEISHSALEHVECV